MPKTFTDTDKRKWLELYDSGKTEKWIAREHARCDARTIKRGIEEARRKQDVVVARRELVKDALRKHQDSLLHELDKILSSTSLPGREYVVLPWHDGGDSILAESETAVSAPSSVSGGEDVLRQLLKEHLRNDRLWKVLVQWGKAHTSHMFARTALQRKIVDVIQKKTGCKMVGGNDAPRPFLYSQATGDLFFRAVLQNAFSERKGIDLETDIAAEAASGDVRYGHGLILAEAPGHEAKIKAGLLAAFKELRGSSEAVLVMETHKTLEESTIRVKPVIEQIKLLGLIPGQCEICRRLGM